MLFSEIEEKFLVQETMINGSKGMYGVTTEYYFWRIHPLLCYVIFQVIR